MSQFKFLMETRILSNQNLTVVAIAIAINLLLFSVAASTASADPWKKRGDTPDAGVVGVGETTNTTDCNPQTTSSSSTKGGVYMKFKVPTTVSNVEGSGHPERPVNFHTAFYGSDGFYREVGMY